MLWFQSFGLTVNSVPLDLFETRPKVQLIALLLSKDFASNEKPF